MKTKRKTPRRSDTVLPPIARRDTSMERLIRHIEDLTGALNRIDSVLRSLHDLLDKRL